MEGEPQRSEEVEYLTRLFADPRQAFEASETNESALDFLDRVRWPSGIGCPRCQSEECYAQAGRADRRWRRCRDCSHQFSPTSGTVLARERLDPSQLVLVVSIASQFTGKALSNGISGATGMTRAGANRLALTMQELFDRQDGADGSDPRLRSAVPYSSMHHWVDPRIGRFTVAKETRQFAFSIAAAALALAAVSLVAWLAGMTDQTVDTEWVHNGQARIVTSQRRVAEDLGDWHLRHSRKVKSMKALLIKFDPPTTSDEKVR